MSRLSLFHRSKSITEVLVYRIEMPGVQKTTFNLMIKHFLHLFGAQKSIGGRIGYRWINTAKLSEDPGVLDLAGRMTEDFEA